MFSTENKEYFNEMSFEENADKLSFDRKSISKNLVFPFTLFYYCRKEYKQQADSSFHDKKKKTSHYDRIFSMSFTGCNIIR